MSNGIVNHVGLRRGRSILFVRTWWWVLVARNGEVLAVSETYISKENRDKTAEQVASQLQVPIIEEY